MRWLVIGLFVSVGVLLLVAGGVARHVWRQRRTQAEESADDAQKAQHLELDKALGLDDKAVSESGSAKDDSSTDRPAR